MKTNNEGGTPASSVLNGQVDAPRASSLPPSPSDAIDHALISLRDGKLTAQDLLDIREALKRLDGPNESQAVAALRKINDTIYSKGAPLGSTAYFIIREAANSVLNPRTDATGSPTTQEKP